MPRKAPAAAPAGRAEKSLRGRLLTLAVLLLAPMVLFVVLLIVLQAMRAQEEAQAGALRVARALAEAVDTQLREVEANLTVLTISDALQKRDFASFHKQALSFQASTGLGTVVVLDEHGQQVVNTSQPFGTPLAALGNRAPAMPIILSGKPMARMVNAPSSGKPIAVVGVPVRIDGKVRFALSTAVGFHRFNDLLRRQSLPPSWIVVILDPARVVVARSSESEKYAGVPASKTLLDALLTSAEGAFDGVSLDGIPVRTLYASAGTRGWSVALGVPKAELAERLRTPLLWLSLATMVVLGLAAASAWWYARRIARAFNRLNDAARELGRGDAVTLPPLGIREADQLAGAMIRASSELRSNEVRWSAVLESAMDGIVAVDEAQRIVIYNPAAERIFGWSREEAMGQPLGMLVPSAHRVAHEGLVRQFGRTGATSRRMGAGVVVSGLRKSGAVFPIEASISHLHLDGGELYTVIVRDVTEAVRTRAELTQLAAEASSVREQEKARIARELHDELAQSLAVIKMDLMQLSGVLRMIDSGAEQSVARMVAEIDASVAATRRIAADLRPPILDDLGLAAAIEWLSEEFTRRRTIPCAVHIRGDLNLEEPFATGVFRILQEALANVAKHAHADRVEVFAECSGEDILFAVVDDGVGFDPGGPRKPLSLGLVGLRERVHLLQGRLVVTSSPGHGTRVEVRISPPGPATVHG